MRPGLRSIATALCLAAVAAGGAHNVALACCFTKLSVVGLLGYSLRDGYWMDWVLAGILALSAVLALASFTVSRMDPPRRAAFARSAAALIWVGLGVALLLPLALWLFVFAPGIDRYFGGAWTYFNLQSPLVETLMDITIGLLVFAFAGWARLKAGGSAAHAAS